MQPVNNKRKLRDSSSLIMGDTAINNEADKISKSYTTSKEPATSNSKSKKEKYLDDEIMIIK